jgi:hypothetical protein
MLQFAARRGVVNFRGSSEPSRNLENLRFLGMNLKEDALLAGKSATFTRVNTERKSNGCFPKLY